MHTAVTVQVFPTTTMFGPHVVCVTLAEFATVTPGMLVHRQYGSVPLHPPLTRHVYVAGEPTSVSVPAHLVFTWHDDATGMVWAGQSVVLCVAPRPSISDGPEEHRQIGAVPAQAMGGPA